MRKGGIGSKGAAYWDFWRGGALYSSRDWQKSSGGVKLTNSRALFLLFLLFLLFIFRIFKRGQIYILVGSRKFVLALIFAPAQSRIKNCSSFSLAALKYFAI